MVNGVGGVYVCLCRMNINSSFVDIEILQIMCIYGVSLQQEITFNLNALFFTTNNFLFTYIYFVNVFFLIVNVKVYVERQLGSAYIFQMYVFHIICLILNPCAQIKYTYIVAVDCVHLINLQSGIFQPLRPFLLLQTLLILQQRTILCY